MDQTNLFQCSLKTALEIETATENLTKLKRKQLDFAKHQGKHTIPFTCQKNIRSAKRNISWSKKSGNTDHIKNLTPTENIDSRSQ